MIAPRVSFSSRVLVNAGASFLWFFLTSSLAVAQIPTATILGSVKDASGAVMPGANIAATQVDTGQTRTTVSSADGSYRFSALSVGNYEIHVEHSGFQSAVRKGLTLSVAQEAVVNFTLDVGAVEQTVSVTAEAPMVNTTTGSLGGLVDPNRMENLPLNGRNYADLTLLQTGVNEHKMTNRGSAHGGKDFSSNGATLHSNTFLLDGANLQSVYGLSSASISSSTLGVDGIQEYRVITNFFSAEYGMTMGGHVMMVSKGGGNAFHGDVFEYLRNSALDARNFFDYRTAATGPNFRLQPFRRNNFGGSFGGPIKKDKTFFYGVYEGLRERLGITTISNVMPAGCHGGAGATITSAACPSLPAGTSVVVAPVIAPLLALYPVANLGTTQFTFPFNQPTTENYEQIRVDQNFSSKDSLFGRDTFDRTTKKATGAYPTFGSVFFSYNQFATVSESHIFSPTLLNIFRSSFSRTNFQTLPSDTVPSDPPYQFVPGLPFAGITIPSTTSPGSAHAGAYKQNIFSEGDDLFYTRGRHSMKFGVLFNHFQQYVLSASGQNGTVVFGSLANFLQALPTSFTAGIPNDQVDRTFHVNTWGFYGQDDLRASARLTVNLGLRYEFTTTPTEVHNDWGAIRDVVKDANMVLSPLFSPNPSLSAFSPRIGFAWDPLGDGKTAVRGGFGVLYDIMSYQAHMWLQAPNANLPKSAAYTASTLNPTASPLLFTVPFTFPSTAASGKQVRPVDYKLPQIHMVQYNMTVDRQLPGSMALTVSYAGSRGLHIPNEMDANPTFPQVINGQKFWTGTEPRRNPNWGTIDLFTAQSNSWYNSLQISLLKRMSRSFQFQTSYTWSKLMDEGSSIGSSEPGGSSPDAMDPLNLRLDKGLGAFDVPQNLHFNGIFNFPDIASNGIAAKFLNGWWSSVILSLQSGEPVTVVLGTNRSRSLNLNSGAGIDRPDLVPGRNNGNITSGTTAGCPGVAAGRKLGTPNLWFDPCAFTIPAVGTLGNEGRNILRGPGFETVDFSLVKDTKLGFLGEGGKLEFRAEIFNLLNKANFAFPNRTAYTAQNSGENALATAGQITSTLDPNSSGAPRQIQFALKILF